MPYLRNGRKMISETASDGHRLAEQRPLLFVAEEVDELADEGYERFSNELAAALSMRRQVLVHFTHKTAGHRWPLIRLVVRMRGIWQVTRRAELKQNKPEACLYASINPISLPALIRACLLRLGTGAPVAMMIIQPNITSALSRTFLRLLPPAMLILGTARECREAQSLGVNSHIVWSGVDLDRFRPPEPGERESLRRKYGLPLDDRIVLHVGHLRHSRNLLALAPLAREPGVTVLLVASRRSWPESEQLRLELEGEGVRVLQGYLPHVEELYRLADCYVFPSTKADHAIALPLSVVEAIGSGLPVVGMRFRALPEQLGRTVGVELVDTAEQLTERVLHMLGSPVNTRALAANFSWDSVAKHLLSVLDDLQERKTTRASSTAPGRS